VRQLSDILKDKSKALGGKASLGRLLGVSGQAILQYSNGAIPSFDIAIKWKQVFNENLIDLMFTDSAPQVQEPQELYLTKEIIDVQKQLIKCMSEKEQISKEFEELKKIYPPGSKQQLEPDVKPTR